MRKALFRWFDSDVGYSFRTSPMAMVAGAIAFLCVFCAVFAGWVAPHNPFDLTTLVLGDARLPPAWEAEGSRKYLLGTDDQGRDILSALIYGARISLVVGAVSVLLSMVIGVSLGLLAGFRGGWIDGFLMRLCDVMLSFPAILVALLIAGVGRALFPNAHDTVAFGVLIIAITLTGWVQYARTVRGSTLVERTRNTCRRRASPAWRRCASWRAMCCPTCWGRCWCWARSTWPPPSSPRRRCRSWAWACRRRRPRSAR
jgi:peptide/nickel transport system permease protein